MTSEKGLFSDQWVHHRAAAGAIDLHTAHASRVVGWTGHARSCFDFQTTSMARLCNMHA